MKKFLPPFLLLIGIIGCNINDLDFSDLEPPKLDGTYAIPLGYVNYTMRELISEIGDESLDLDEDSTSLLQLTYRDTAEFGSGNELVEIEDIVNNGTILMSNSTNSSGDVTTVRFDSTFTFTYPAENNEEIDSIFYQTGTLSLDITKTFPYDLIYNVTIQNTRTESTDIPVNLSGTLTESSGSSSQDLSDYKTALSFQNNQNTFEFAVTLDVILEPGESITVSDLVLFDLVYQDQTFDLLFGRFGQDTANIGNQVIDIEFFEDLGESGLEFGAPEITFTFENSFGVPLGVLFRGLYGVNGDSISADTTYLEGAITNSAQVIDQAVSLGETATSTIKIDRSNSTIQDLLSESPNKLGFNLSAISNPEDASAPNFLVDTSRVRTFIEMYMPLEISMNNLTREIDFDLGDGLSFDEADSVSIRIVSDNGLPFSARLEFEILNDSSEVAYSVPSSLILEVPFIDAKGLVAQSRKNIADIPLGKEGILALNAGGTLLLRFILNTPGNSSRDTFIKVLADYSIDIKVALVGKINYQP